MKRFMKLGIATLVLAAGVVAFSAFKKLAILDYQWTNSTNFQIGTSPSTPISTITNYASGTTTTGGSTYLSQVEASYSGSTAPTEQSILDAVKTEYDRLKNISQSTLLSTFVDGYQFTASPSGVSTQITVFLKD